MLLAALYHNSHNSFYISKKEYSIDVSIGKYRQEEEFNSLRKLSSAVSFIQKNSIERTILVGSGTCSYYIHLLIVHHEALYF